MNNWIFIIVSSLIALTFAACNLNSGSTGVVKLNLTDAPIDADNVTGVYITITEIQYNMNRDDGETWETLEEFQGPKTYNLLELQNGKSVLLGELILTAGQYNQIRFLLDIPEQGGAAPSNPGCYIEYSDETTEPLFVPSGGNSGYKATGTFQVPVNGAVELTADFDVRKAVVAAGDSGKIILKPTIRLIANNQAGRISGSITGYTGENELLVFAYESGDYSETESAEPESGESRFPNAVTSTSVDDESGYQLWYLAPGEYDLVVAEYTDGTFVQVSGVITGIAVEAEGNTSRIIDFSLF
ncbi:MAG: DUF4382 domain-containing protein [Spirochaetia bacterium]